MDTDFKHEFRLTNNEISKWMQKGADNFEKLNNRQSQLDEELAERFKQLDIQNVKIAQVERIMESYREEVNYLKGFWQDLDNNKTNQIEFLEHKIEFENQTRKIRVNHDNLVNRVTNLENFCDKYVPLIAQNVVCDTLTQVAGSKERKKLELYEQKVYMNLHKTILNDGGTPNLEEHRNVLLTQINDKLEILTRIINERKFLVPKEKPNKRSKGDKPEISTNAMKYKKKQNQGIKRAEFNEDSGQIEMKEYKIELDPEEEKEIKRAEEAERMIRQMEANKGLMNYHRISEKELEEIGSISTSDIDYAEVFDERITVSIFNKQL